MGKLTGFILGMIAFSMIIMASFSPLLVQLNENYGPSGYDANRTESYNKMAELESDVNKIDNSSRGMSSESGIQDVIGGFFESAYNTVKVTFNSFTLFNSMKADALSDLNVPNQEIWESGIGMMVIMTLVFGVIVAAAVKSPL